MSGHTDVHQTHCQPSKTMYCNGLKKKNRQCMGAKSLQQNVYGYGTAQFFSESTYMIDKILFGLGLHDVTQLVEL